MQRTLAVILLLGTAWPAASRAAEPPTGAGHELRLEIGRRVAETWCAKCHVVGPAARGPVGDAAPPFQDVARMPSTTALSLRAFLQTPHPPMPDYRLSQQELDGVIAWILAQRDG